MSARGRAQIKTGISQPQLILNSWYFFEAQNNQNKASKNHFLLGRNTIGPENIISRNKGEDNPSNGGSFSAHHETTMMIWWHFRIVDVVKWWFYLKLCCLLMGKRRYLHWQARLFIMAQDREWWSRQLHISRDGSFSLSNKSWNRLLPHYSLKVVKIPTFQKVKLSSSLRHNSAVSLEKRPTQLLIIIDPFLSRLLLYYVFKS